MLMQKVYFHKYQATGNDFVLVDNRDLVFDGSNISLIAAICHRRFGIGADGLILLEPSSRHLFTMRYYNSDGREASMCGNGGRCISAFAHKLGLAELHSRFRFEAVDGEHEAEVKEGSVTLKISDVDRVDEFEDGYFMNTGSPHLIRFVDNPSAVDVAAEGARWRNDPRFSPDGTNVNFVRRASRTIVPMRTFERGVEAETLSCGTGAVASAIAVSLKTGTGNLFNMQVPGGELTVSFDKSGGNNFYNIWLTGPAIEVFEGTMEI